jgi:hypothetical protein
VLPGGSYAIKGGPAETVKVMHGDSLREGGETEYVKPLDKKKTPKI